MPIKTFRGLIADEAQDIISLHTNDGSTGYRIVKLQLFPNDPGIQHQEHTVKIYKVSQPVGTIDNVVDFSDNRLLAAAYYQDNATYPPAALDVIFDRELFNQDIYVTAADTAGANPINYYIELEQVKLDLNENTVATLKDIRNNA